MAKHAKPSVTSTLSKNGARGAAALAMASFGFVATAPAAFAGDDQDHKKHGDAHHGYQSKDIDSHESEGVVNVADNDAVVPVQACNNYVPVNVLGVQVPVEDVAVNVPILSEDDNDAETPDTCQQATAVD